MRGGETVIGTKMHLRKKSTSTLGIKGEERAGRNRGGYFSPDREKRGTQTYKHTEEHSLSDLFAVTRATRTERERERERENKHERTNTDTDTDIRTHTHQIDTARPATVLASFSRSPEPSSCAEEDL
jgi:hypothetical protein